MKVTEKLLVNFYSEIIQYLESIKKLTEKDVDAKKYYKQLGKYLYDAEISGLLSDNESTQKEFLDLFRRLHTIANDILDMDLGTSFKDASDFYDNFKKEQIQKLRENKELLYLDIDKFNIPKTIVTELRKTLGEISLSTDNAAQISGDLDSGNFDVNGKEYEFTVNKIKNPYTNQEDLHNIQFFPKGEKTSLPTQDTDSGDYIKILSTLYKIITDYVESENPEYLGIASLDNDGSKNYHTIYNSLTDPRNNRIKGYSRKSANLPFKSPDGKGRMVVLKKSGSLKELSEKTSTIDKIYCDINEVLADTDTPDLDWTDDGMKLWEYLFMTAKPVTLLSSTSNQEHKEKWIKNAFAPQFVPPVIFRSSGDKQEFSQPGALLIDNKESTIDEWREKGGTGILHKDADDTIKQLKNLGL